MLGNISADQTWKLGITTSLGPVFLLYFDYIRVHKQTKQSKLMSLGPEKNRNFVKSGILLYIYQISLY